MELYRPHEHARIRSLEAALKLKELLASKDLNVVTAESLTAGMIAKTLIDIPRYGATVYGGHVVYDTDAKRKYLNVKTEGVYSSRTAHQMAVGALINSRAMVSVAVTGNSMAVPEHVDLMGVVDIGVARRMETGIIVSTKRMNVCDMKGYDNLCAGWKKLHKGNGEFAPAAYTSYLSDIIRLETVVEACNYAYNIIKRVTRPWGKIHNEGFDQYCKPSYIIEKHLAESKSAYQCDDTSSDDLFSSVLRDHAQSKLPTKHFNVVDDDDYDY